MTEIWFLPKMTFLEPLCSGGTIWCNNKTTTMVDALVFRPGPLHQGVADPGAVDPDPDPTLKRKVSGSCRQEKNCSGSDHRKKNRIMNRFNFGLMNSPLNFFLRYKSQTDIYNRCVIGKKSRQDGGFGWSSPGSWFEPQEKSSIRIWIRPSRKKSGSWFAPHTRNRTYPDPHTSLHLRVFCVTQTWQGLKIYPNYSTIPLRGIYFNIHIYPWIHYLSCKISICSLICVS